MRRTFRFFVGRAITAKVRAMRTTGDRDDAGCGVCLKRRVKMLRKVVTMVFVVSVACLVPREWGGHYYVELFLWGWFCADVETLTRAV